MVKIENDLGMICITSEVFTNIAGEAATNCFGVKGMAARSKTDGLVHLLRHESLSRYAGRGLDVMRLQLIGGHRDIRHLQRYAKLSAADLASE